MYKTEYIISKISLTDYVRNYRNADKFIGYCKKCNRYNACWACPPFDFDTDAELSRYKTAWIIGIKINLADNVIENSKGWELCTPLTYRIIKEVRQPLDGMLLNLEKKYPDSRAFFAGTCHICSVGECARIRQKPCIYPDKVRSSLESFGFDVSLTSLRLLGVEMKWSINGILPPYFVLVSGFLTNNDISIQEESQKSVKSNRASLRSPQG
jgi:predicted metal-binding protein